jgi:hypothetical protein
VVVLQRQVLTVVVEPAVVMLDLCMVVVVMVPFCVVE